ncbi:unnamed protein product [Haemonchus placei]|uniref:Sulfotransferase family protein n=1 Tax=Haemonchus placei TaxID=6290 RepID=A0A0N4X9W8_HAEPC|nr:unnamed protein product [Haemonchus placei]
MLSLRLVGPLRTGSSFLARRSITTYVASSPGRASIRLRLLAVATGAGLYTALHLKRVHCEALLEDPWLLTPHVVGAMY